MLSTIEINRGVTDLISAVVQLPRRDMNGLVETAREALPWDEG